MNISLSEAEVSFIALIYIFNLTDTLDFCSCSRRLSPRTPVFPISNCLCKKVCARPWCEMQLVADDVRNY